MVVVLAWIALHLNWRSLGEVFLGCSWPWLAGALLLTPLAVAMLTKRVQLLLGAQGIALHFSQLLRLTWIGQFFNTFLPGSTGGDFYKLYRIGHLAPSAHSKGVAAIVLDRAAALVALLALSAVAFALEPAPLHALASHTLSVPRVVRFTAAVLALLAVAAWAARSRWAPTEAQLTGWPRKFRKVASHLRFGLSDRVAFSKAVVWAAATHSCNFTVVWLLSRGLHLNVSFVQVLTMMPVVLFVVLLPLSINGHGLRELVMIAYFRLFHVSADPAAAAVALSLAFVATDFMSASPGGFIYLLSGRAAPGP